MSESVFPSRRSHRGANKVPRPEESLRSAKSAASAGAFPAWKFTPPDRPRGAALASDLVGSNPRGAERRISLAVRSTLDDVFSWMESPLVIVACSGGADSLALAVAAIDICARRNVPVHTVTIDHGVREGSAAEAQRVAEICRQLGATQAEVVTLSEKTMQDARWLSGPEGGAREARHNALARVARVYRRVLRRNVLLLYGHTMDDQAETVLLGLGRGSGARSLAGMQNISAPEDDASPYSARPLLEVRRVDTVSACSGFGLAPVQDPTNRANGPWRTADGSALRRAAVREFALPALASALGKDVAPALVRTAAQLRRDNECLDEIAAEVLKLVQCEPGVSAFTGTMARLDLDWEKLGDLHPGVLSRVLRFAALEAGAEGASLSSVQIDAMMALVVNYSGQGAVYLPGKVVVQRVRLDPPTPRGRPGLVVPAPEAPVRLRFS